MPGWTALKCAAARFAEFKQTLAFLTARGGLFRRCAGFDAGADDYITKPVRPRCS